jgi:hypothetical protein
VKKKSVAKPEKTFLGKGKYRRFAASRRWKNDDARPEEQSSPVGPAQPKGKILPFATERKENGFPLN